METQEKSTFKDYLYSSKLPIQLTTLARPIIASHLEQISENKSLNYDDLGDDREKRIKKAISVFTNLQIVVEDLDKVIYFLSMPKLDVQKLYPLISVEDYYNYHLENYVIRVNSIPDVLAGLGNLICQWGIKDKKCYGTSIPDSPQIDDQRIKEIMNSLLSKTNSIRSIRNKKMHAGSADITYFERATLWDAIESIGISLTSELEELSREKKIEAVKLIKSEIYGVLDDVIDFMDVISSDLN